MKRKEVERKEVDNLSRSTNEMRMRQFENSCIEYEPRLYSERERKEEPISSHDEGAPRGERVKDERLQLLFDINSE